MGRSKKRKHEETDAITVSSPSRKESKKSKFGFDPLHPGMSSLSLTQKVKRERHLQDEPALLAVSSGSSSGAAQKLAAIGVSERFDAFGNALSELILASAVSDMEKSLGEEKANFFTALQTMHSTGDLPWLNEYLEKAKQRQRDTNENGGPEQYPPLTNSITNTTPPNPTWPPPLPPITSPTLRQQAFTHKSFIKGEDAGLPGTEQQHYERLEFLGDSYLQSITSHILYTRFPHLREGALSDMRQQLVANRPLSTYATLYRFHEQVRESKGQSTAAPVALVHTPRGTLRDIGVNKTLADCFEAYIAAVVLDSPAGVDVAQAWLTHLFEPKLKEMEAQHAAVGPIDKMAKQTLNTIVGGNRATVEYKWTDGQGGNKGGYWITVYLTGWGFSKRAIGNGWGTNKGDATLRAAMNCISNEDFCREMSAIKTKYLGPKPTPLPPSNVPFISAPSPEYIPPE